MKRDYQGVLAEHFAINRQMAFLSGPRQVGKTTLLNALAPAPYLNWDDPADKLVFNAGADAIATHCGLDVWHPDDAKPLLAFDEIHKYARWKNTLKGFFDKYGKRARIVVTGSARLDIYKRGGDSLRGRYLGYRIHPLSLGEIAGAPLDPETLLRPPATCDADVLATLARFGGFPEPFLKANTRFHRQWLRLQRDQILREEVRDITAIREIALIETLGHFLSAQAGGEVKFSGLGNHLQVSTDSVRRWCSTLSALYFCHFVRPYSRNIRRSLIKEPKVYLWDWSAAPEGGQRWENLVAGHLLKAVHYWTDLGLGDFALHFLRDKEKREIDFLVVRDAKPWFLVEVKTSASAPLSNALAYFQAATGAAHAWQVAADLPPAGADCFTAKTPVKLSLADLLLRLP
ncbi:MAG: AAA family ATPase [Puniceicoccales bacterium]|jgi:predicted AAA+ superfamily ATPase|nr:AAA family ATPase [Puniceicoccales bacterium]